MTTGTSAARSANPSLWKQLTAFHRVKLVFLAASFFSFALSVALWFLVDRETGLFVGLWVPTLLALGVLVLLGEEGSS